MVKVHHTLGDSNAIIAALSKLFDREGRDREASPLNGPFTSPGAATCP